MGPKGLTTHEAKLRFNQFGPNSLSQDKSFRVLSLVLHEIFSLMNLLLLSAASIAIYIGDVTDGILIIAIVLLNSAVSFWQEAKAERTLEELRRLSPSSVRVFRDNREILLPAEDLVPGDVVRLETGDKIPADGWVMEAFNFESNESALTGESVPVYKKPDEPEHDTVFGGTLVASGRAAICITATGKDSRFGIIAQTLNALGETPTPLQNQIKKLAYVLAGLAILLSAAIYVIGVSFGSNAFEMFFTAVSSMVAMVPEGLPSIILITLAVGVKRMATKKAIVRKLLAIEGLGSVSVICTDKTGTLTRGEMRVAQIYFDGAFHSPHQFRVLTDKLSKKIIDVAVIVNTASLAQRFGQQSNDVLGDTTEGALLLFAKEIGIDYEMHRNKCKVLDEFSFDDKLKSMSVVCNINGEVEALVKGSPERVIKSSSRHLENGKVKPLDQDGRQKLIEAYENLSRKGYRVLGLAYKDRMVNSRKYDRDQVESDLICLGFIALSDPVRPEAKASIIAAKIAGIKTVMVTGDNAYTAMAVAKELGLAVEGDEVVLGQDLEKFSDDELANILPNVSVFARTNPEDKLRIVSAYQKLNYSVAVTGDGVNDALALKQAEIGIAMGKKGTDVAKEAADIVITDDNYATIITAVVEGRTIYDNVHRSIRYLLSTNIGEVFTILFALSLGLPSPLLPVQILWINLATDGLPALALALGAKDPHALQRKPRPKGEPILSPRHLLRLVISGLVISFVVLAAYYIVLHKTDDLTLARTWTFNVMIVLQMIIAFVVHGIKRRPTARLVSAVAVTLLVQFIILSSQRLSILFGITSLF